ncbi:MAG: tetratricopeptide repeat protein [Bacteroidota bacterium]
MKTVIQFAMVSITTTLILSSCTLTREPFRNHDEYFRPVTTISQRSDATLPSNDIEQLKSQLQLANQRMAILLDSLKSMQHYTGLLLASTRDLVDKVDQLESREFMAINKQKELEQNVVTLQAENKDFFQQLKELRMRLFAGNVNTVPQVFSPASITSSLRDEYSEGVSLFRQRKYEEALTTFSSLLDKGIEENLADNCEYWIGECHFGQQNYDQAINSFQKVLTIKSSNKKIDAYFMLGKSYEQINDLVKARWAYEELSLLYPNNVHARFVESRLNVIKRTLPLPQESKHKKTTT